MEINGVFVPQFRGVQFQLRRVTRVVVRRTRHAPLCSVVKVSCASSSPSPNPFCENFPIPYHKWKTIEVRCKDSLQSAQQSSPPTHDSSRLPELTFNRLQLSDEECFGVQKHSFGQFIARRALLDEEYWTAAWLRAEAHWESVSYLRNVDNYKRKYAEQEFYALKQRCAGRDGNSLKCSCIVTVKKEEKNVRRTVLNSVVGTLDVSIRQFLQGETFPGELKKYSAVLASHEAYDAHKYAYIANVCVSKFARRQGIASNMLHLGSDLAASAGMKQLYVHVNADNYAAQELYRKSGFKMVEAAASQTSKDQRFLMCMRL